MDGDAAHISGHLAWRGVSKVAADLDSATVELTVLADAMPSLLAAVETADAAATPHPARVAASVELAVAAARHRHVAMRLQVAAAQLVINESAHLSDAEPTARTWLAKHGGMSRGAASEVCRVAETCERFPLLGAAFYAGEITAGHVDAVSRIIPTRFKGDDLAEAIEKVRGVQDVLLGAATGRSVGEFSDLCAGARDRLDGDGPTDPAAEPSRVWLKRLFNGRWSMSGDLAPDDGAMIESYLQRLRARRARARARSAGARPEAARSKGAQPDAARSDGAQPEAAPTPSEHRAGDLIDLVRAGAGADQPGRIALHLHIDLADLNAELNAGVHGAPDGLPEMLSGRRRAHTEAGLDVSDDTLWALMADADVTPYFTWDGRSLSYGRTRRLAPDELRRMLAHRDRQCRFPGCDRPPVWLEAHHVVFWDDGGETDPSNCVGYCTFHHHGVHDRGFRVTGDAEGQLVVTNPDGTPFDPSPRYRRTADPPEGADGQGDVEGRRTS